MSATLARTPHFDLVDLRLFVKVADASSLTRGAEQSSLSLAAASLRIKRLEESLGSQLFYRTKRGVSPTSGGEVFLSHARAVLQNIDRLQGEMLAFSRGTRGHVRIFATAPAVSELLPAALATFFSLHGSITLDLHERPSVEIVQAVQQDRC